MAMLPDDLYNHVEHRIRTNMPDIAKAEYRLRRAKSKSEQKAIGAELAELDVWKACIDKVTKRFAGQMEADVARIIWPEARSMDEAAAELFAVRQTIRRCKERFVTHVAVEALKEGLVKDV